VRNGVLTELAWTRRGGWAETSPGGAFKDSPSALFDPLTSNVEVYAKGADGTLREDAHPAAGWTGIRTLGGGVQLGSDPVPFVSDEVVVRGGLDIFAVYNGQLSEVAWSASTHSWNWWRVVA